MNVDIPASVRTAATDRRSGANEIALAAVDGLLEIARGDPAARSPEPLSALTRLREVLLTEADAAVRAARAWLEERVGSGTPVATVSHSSLVVRVLEGRPTDDGREGPRVAVMGADAIGPAEVLNAAGSLALVARLPTLVVATSVKLVPAEVFERLAAPGFERVPLRRLAAVALGVGAVSPEEAGQRAASATSEAQ
jgi:hypothetical protein